MPPSCLHSLVLAVICLSPVSSCLKWSMSVHCSAPHACSMVTCFVCLVCSDLTNQDVLGTLNANLGLLTAARNISLEGNRYATCAGTSK